MLCSLHVQAAPVLLGTALVSRALAQPQPHIYIGTTTAQCNIMCMIHQLELEAASLASSCNGPCSIGTADVVVVTTTAA
jgi:hypothetical protein